MTPVNAHITPETPYFVPADKIAEITAFGATTVLIDDEPIVNLSIVAVVSGLVVGGGSKISAPNNQFGISGYLKDAAT